MGPVNKTLPESTTLRLPKGRAIQEERFHENVREQARQIAFISCHLLTQWLPECTARKDVETLPQLSGKKLCGHCLPQMWEQRVGGLEPSASHCDPGTPAACCIRSRRWGLPAEKALDEAGFLTPPPKAQGQKCGLYRAKVFRLFL